jgi:hypothetical protein
MPEGARTYGEFVLATDLRIQRADHILGARIELDTKGRPDQVAIQFEDVDGPCELRLDFVQALALLSMLKCIQLDTRTPFPDDPRGVRDQPLC